MYFSDDRVDVVVQDKPQYTLASLDDVINSVDDLDLQHVLAIYKKHYNQVNYIQSGINALERNPFVGRI